MMIVLDFKDKPRHYPVNPVKNHLMIFLADSRFII